MSATEPTPTPPAAPKAPAVPEEPLFEHAYDGIQEYDNPMPRWWVWIFWATIVYSAVYLLNVLPLVGEGRGRIAQYEDDIAQAGRKYATARGPRPAPDDDALRALAADAGAREGGKALYMTNCMPCHRADAGRAVSGGDGRAARPRRAANRRLRHRCASRGDVPTHGECRRRVERSTCESDCESGGGRDQGPAVDGQRRHLDAGERAAGLGGRFQDLGQRNRLES